MVDWSRRLRHNANWPSDRRQRIVVERFFSGWKSGTSGEPYGLLLRPYLSVIYYIKQLEVNIRGVISKFAMTYRLIVLWIARKIV